MIAFSGHALAVGDIALTGELVQQPIGDVVEIMQPVAQIGVGLALHARAGVVLDALDGGLRGQAGHHRLAKAAHPAAVVCDHADGLEHFAMLAGAHAVAMGDEFVDRGAHGVDRLLQPPEFAGDVLGHELLDDDARLVEQHMAEADALDHRRTPERGGTVEREVAGVLYRLQLARGDEFGEEHRRRLKRLDFLLGIDAANLVLDDEHAERVAAAQDRYAEEGVVDFFARLRLVGEGRMLLRLGERQRLGALGDEADEAFARVHGGLMHGLAIEAFGGVKFETLVGAQHVDGADLGDHVRGDLHHDLVETRLRAHRLRADFAQPAQQKAGAAKSATHQIRSRLHGAAGGRTVAKMNVA